MVDLGQGGTERLPRSRAGAADGHAGSDDRASGDAAAGDVADRAELADGRVDRADLGAGRLGVDIDEALQAADKAVEVGLRADAKAARTGVARRALLVEVECRLARLLARRRDLLGADDRLAGHDGRVGQRPVEQRRHVAGSCSDGSAASWSLPAAGLTDESGAENGKSSRQLEHHLRTKSISGTVCNKQASTHLASGSLNNRGSLYCELESVRNGGVTVW